MNEGTLERALGLDIAPKTPAQLEAIAQALTEVSDEMDGISSRLALIARALTQETVAVLGREEDDRRAGLSTRERILEDTAPASDTAVLRSIEDPNDELCLQCDALLPEGAAWLCPGCFEAMQAEGDASDKAAMAAAIERASAASGATGAPAPLDTVEGFEVLP